MLFDVRWIQTVYSNDAEILKSAQTSQAGLHLDDLTYSTIALVDPQARAKTPVSLWSGKNQSDLEFVKDFKKELPIQDKGVPKQRFYTMEYVASYSIGYKARNI